MVTNPQQYVYIFACSFSVEAIDDWFSVLRERAKSKGIEYKGPHAPPNVNIKGKKIRRRKMELELEAIEELLYDDVPNEVYIEIGYDTQVTPDVREVLPDSEIPDERVSETQGTSKTQNTVTSSGEEIDESKQLKKDNPKRKEKLSELRTKAEADANEDIPESATTSVTTTQQYTRSSAIRDYVMSRADGYCEGCEEPAPFTSKTGEPYLHAHHVYELSEGGSDTPDTVIALCPNCHYRVHHGEDGDEYNQTLIDKLEQIE